MASTFINLPSTSGGVVTGAFLDGGNTFGANSSIGNNDAFSLSLKTNNTDRITILSNGNVGIGTATPTEKLELNGNSLFFDSTAVTGLTKVTVKAGAGQTTTNLVEIQNNSAAILYSANSSGTPSAVTDLTTKAYVDTTAAAAGGLYVRKDGSVALTSSWSAGQAITATTLTGSTRVVASATGANALAVTGAPAASAVNSLVQLGPVIAGGSANGTYLGANPAAFTGNFIDLQVAGVRQFSVSSAGVITGNGSGITGISGTISGLTAGRVPYATSATALADSANFQWDNTNTVLSVGGARNGNFSGGRFQVIGASTLISATPSTIIFGTPGGGSQGTVGADSGGAMGLLLTSAASRILMSNSGSGTQVTIGSAVGTFDTFAASNTLVIADRTAATGTTRQVIQQGAQTTGGANGGLNLLEFKTTHATVGGGTLLSYVNNDGFFYQPGAPTAATNQAATTSYVDSAITTAAGSYLKKDGSVALTAAWDAGAQAIKNVSTLSIGSATVPTGGVAYFNGNVGVGTTTPTAGLHVATAGAASTPGERIDGAWFTGGSATTTKPQFLVEPSGATSNAWSTAGTGIGLNSASSFTGNLVDFQQNGSSKFSIDALGTTRAGAFASNLGYFNSLEPNGLNGSLRVPASWFSGGTSTTNKPILYLEPNGVTSTGWSTGGTGFGVNSISGFLGNLIDAQLNGASKFKVDYTGLVSTAAVTLTNLSGGGTTTASIDNSGNIIRTVSDGRLKTQIEPLEGSLDRILKVQGVSYYWKDQETFGSAKDIGFIAQDLEKVVPEVVKQSSDPEHLRSVNYANMVALIVEAIKEMYQDVTDHSREIASLKSEVSLKTDEMTQLKMRVDNLEQMLSLK
jgi:hypothetical protein